MDPLLRRLTAGPRGRLIVGGALAAGAAALAGAVVLASAQGSGSETALPVTAVQRAPTAAATPLLVQVGGAVRRPGLVSLPPGSRVVDAVAAAGGPARDADPQAVNLAAPVADGQQVVVPARGAASAAATGAAAAPSSGTVALNSATAEQLETLPRIGPALAARILAYRAAHGDFRSVDELGEVGGIGPKTLAGLRDRVVL